MNYFTKRNTRAEEEESNLREEGECDRGRKKAGFWRTEGGAGCLLKQDYLSRLVEWLPE